MSRRVSPYAIKKKKKANNQLDLDMQNIWAKGRNAKGGSGKGKKHSRRVTLSRSMVSERADGFRGRGSRGALPSPRRTDGRV